MSHKSLGTQWKKKVLVFVIILFAGMLAAQVRQVPADQQIQKVHTLYWKATCENTGEEDQEGHIRDRDPAECAFQECGEV